MAYDERLFERIRDVLERKSGWTERPLFGGRAYVVNGHPFIAAVDAGLIVRCSDEALRRHLELKYCAKFAHKGKPLPGWLLVDMEALKTAKQLSRWVESSYVYATGMKPAGKRRVE